MQNFVVWPSKGPTTAKLVVLHGGLQTGHEIQSYAGLDYLADKHGIAIHYPTAHPVRTWIFRGGLGDKQLGFLKAMVAGPPQVPVILYGYSRGAIMAMKWMVEDNSIAGCISYAGMIHSNGGVHHYGNGTCPILLVRNASDITISADDLDTMQGGFKIAGHPVTTLTGRGGHLAMSDQGLNPLFEQWILTAIKEWKK